MTGAAGPGVGVVRDAADLAACMEVREAVFVIEQGVPAELEYDELDAVATHFLARAADGSPLGTARLLHGRAAEPRTGAGPTVGSLGRLAVTGAARGTGVGAHLVRAVEAEAARIGLEAVDLHAQTHALGFYERLGYRAHGPEFPDAGIPHRAMRRALV
ncbi:GNAT family N-acetyltransferase [Streptomyces sp. BI20]|uniref:GNAT family N-acetyltransferase n=1 Tax=Streptomyces sp. BI20 TaxID=3403460 RepID=UPI003C75B583